MKLKKLDDVYINESDDIVDFWTKFETKSKWQTIIINSKDGNTIYQSTNGSFDVYVTRRDLEIIDGEFVARYNIAKAKDVITNDNVDISYITYVFKEYAVILIAGKFDSHHEMLYFK